MARIRWGRVAFAVGVPPLAWGCAALALVAAAFATAPAPDRPARRSGGACETGEALGRLAELPLADGPVGDADLGAVAGLLAATRCGAVTEIPADDLVPAWAVARRAVDWIAARERPEEAVRHLLDVWELASDQRRAATYTGVVFLSALGELVGEHLEELLPQLPPAARASARARLERLADDRPDWRAAARRDEAWVWSVAATAPGAAPELAYAWAQARFVSPPPIAVEVETSARTVARVLAGR